MEKELADFAIDLANNTKTHGEWLAVVKFGREQLLRDPGLLFQIIADEAQRNADRVNKNLPEPRFTARNHIADILAELDLKLTAA